MHLIFFALMAVFSNHALAQQSCAEMFASVLSPNQDVVFKTELQKTLVDRSDFFEKNRMEIVGYWLQKYQNHSELVIVVLNTYIESMHSQEAVWISPKNYRRALWIAKYIHSKETSPEQSMKINSTINDFLIYTMPDVSIAVH